MPQKIIIAEQERIAALLSDGRVEKLIVAQGHYQIGDIFLGTIENVLPGIDAAFVNIGASEKNGFIHVTDLGPLKLKKNAGSITELLEPRQKVLVQVMKEPTGNKGPRLTGNISLPGRYLVLQPNGQGVNVSRQINIENERNRLKALGVLIKPPGTGILLRSEAEEVSEEFIIDDLEQLIKKWESIQEASERANPPTLLRRDEDFIHRVLRDHINSEVSEIIVETNEGKEKAQGFLAKEKSHVKIEQLLETSNLIEHFKIDIAILNALKPRVDLPSGGYIIIEPTEALTVIDVNSGSFTRSANSRETVLWTNCEAAVEIARQLKLRNIGGVIIIDFIDMESRRDQLQLLEYFTAAIKDDSSRPQISQLTELGLVELTRKRQGQNIYELFSTECSNCSGLGHIPSIPEKGKPQTLEANAGLPKNEVNLQASISITNPNKQNESVIEDSQGVITKKINNSESTNKKEEKDNIIIEMDEEHQYVYSELGLNPILILQNQPETDNFSIEVKLSDDKNSEKINQDLSPIDSSLNINLNGEESLDKKNNLLNNENNKIEDETNLTIDSKENSNSLNEIQDPSLDQSDKNIIAEDEIEDPRRRRRRSSATN